MKITKAMGRACIEQMRQLYDGAEPDFDCMAAELSWHALDRLHGGWGAMSDDFANNGHYLTALAMCAAIAGVKP